MPELPEVETVRCGIIPHLINQRVKAVYIRQPRLRWLVPNELASQIPGAIIEQIHRRGKYLLIQTNRGTLIIHLGMSGSLRILSTVDIAGKHDHIDLKLSNNKLLRFNDPRRFGAWLWTIDDALLHPLLASLGPEPLTPNFNGEYLYAKSRSRKTTIKQFIMDNQIVVGVGNIYASEALFLAGIHPAQAANLISKQRYKRLADSIKQILNYAITVGGTTIRNFSDSAGKPGYFKQQLWVYGRKLQACKKCESLLKELRLGQRSTVFCPKCQKKK